MALSKSTRITIMLAIDVVFFLVELIAGFMVHSLALMADAFHMLNDIISLLVGLWAVNLARKQTTDKYSFGWLRAEILGAFFNAVFLIALCVSIILEALTRFIDPPEISNPVLILVVGCFGLASNIVGFVVLGGHGHSHGPDEHDHDHEHGQERTVEEGRADGPYGTVDPADEAGPATDVLPEVAVARVTARGSEATKRITFENEPQPQSAPERCNSKTSVQSRGRERRRAGSMRHSRLTSIDDISIYPSSFRQDIIAASRSSMEPSKLDDDSLSDSSTGEDATGEDAAGGGGGGGGADAEHTETSPLLIKRASNGKDSHSRTRSASKKRRRSDCGGHRNHYHSNPDKAGGKNGGGGHGHSHGDMGMNAMVLHVLGDALGNVGVIVTALVIWLTDWWWKCYADPAVSLFITVIILRSALPLTFATSKILLQATPDHINVNEIRRDIEMLDGVVSCHHVHIWQLSDTKLVASMHIQVAFPISEGSGSKYMLLAKEARRCLHAYGIHSATIQPEFCLDESHAHAEESQQQQALRFDGADGGAKLCLLDCVDDCVGKGCCSVAGSATGSVAGSARRNSDGSGHSPDSHGSHHH